jgi:hypothetical protein
LFDSLELATDCFSLILLVIEDRHFGFSIGTSLRSFISSPKSPSSPSSSSDYFSLSILLTNKIPSLFFCKLSNGISVLFFFKNPVWLEDIGISI